jgi:uncharacterized protein YjbI with pentapeptide repeats
VGTNQEPAQLVVRRISDCAVVRSTADGHDAHIADSDIDSDNSSEDNCDFAYCNIAHSDFAHSDFAHSDFAHSNIASFGGCFRVPRRLV